VSREDRRRPPLASPLAAAVPLSCTIVKVALTRAPAVPLSSSRMRGLLMFRTL